MVITGQTIIANKYFDQYNDVKRRIPAENVYEGFLYHGSRISNHQKIVKKHLYMPGVDKEIKQLDAGYYGVGIYATENIFYASIYANKYPNPLKVNEKTSVICCRVIFDKTKVNEVKNLSLMGKKIDHTIADNFGINHTVVGDSLRYRPLSESPQNRNIIVAEEYVFPYKYQIIPICSFTVMRTDYFILWKDENIGNLENTRYMKELSKKMQVNVYFKRTVNDALQLINLKKKNKIKLITNGGNELSGKRLIEEARKITRSNFVCLVFARDYNHFQWISKMENVLFTNDSSFFREFASLQMNIDEVLRFVEKLENSIHFKFNINRDELLKFPLHIKNKFNEYYNESYINDDIPYNNPDLNLENNTRRSYNNSNAVSTTNSNTNSSNSSSTNSNVNPNTNSNTTSEAKTKKKCEIF